MNCPAWLHCTLKAARKESGCCVCPRTLALQEHQRAYMRWYMATVMKARRNARATPRWLKAGPWKILDECPATGHNIIRHARGLDGLAKCICPRATALRTEYNAVRRIDEKEARTVKMEQEIRLPVAVPKNIHQFDAPDWARAVCRKSENIPVVDLGFEISRTRVARSGRAMAKLLCATCPLQQVCLAWVMQEEEPAGSWGGVWGGMDPWERVKAAKSRA